MTEVGLSDGDNFGGNEHGHKTYGRTVVRHPEVRFDSEGFVTDTTVGSE